MASPFTMALSGLVTRNVAGYVKKFHLKGDWKEYDLKDCATAGRVPDGSMMLNTLVRVAIERMTGLSEFRSVPYSALLQWRLIGETIVGSLTQECCRPSGEDWRNQR